MWAVMYPSPDGKSPSFISTIATVNDVYAISLILFALSTLLKTNLEKEWKYMSLPFVFGVRLGIFGFGVRLDTPGFDVGETAAI